MLRCERERGTAPLKPRRLTRTRALIGVAAIVAACLGGEARSAGSPPFTGLPAVADGRPRALLCVGPLPRPLQFTVHPWFLTWTPEERVWHRWEVWQDGGGRWDHVHLDTFPAAAGSDMGGGPAVVLAGWEGEEAARLARTLARESPLYPHCHRYLAWPGPNSNTYVAAMLREAGLSLDLPASMIGRQWGRFAGFDLGAPPGGWGLALDTPVMGLTIGVREGIEARVLALPVGVDPWPPALRIPLGDGRIGWDE